jgi:hypothetical protein
MSFIPSSFLTLSIHCQGEEEEEEEKKYKK